MFILGFFAGLLIMLLIDLAAGVYQKHKSQRDFVHSAK